MTDPSCFPEHDKSHHTEWRPAYGSYCYDCETYVKNADGETIVRAKHNPNSSTVTIRGDWPVGVREGIRINHILERDDYDQLPIHIPPGGYQ